MKVRVIAKVDGKEASLTLKENGKIHLYGSEFEINDEKANKLIDEKLVERVKESKGNAQNKEQNQS